MLSHALADEQVAGFYVSHAPHVFTLTEGVVAGFALRDGVAGFELHNEGTFTPIEDISDVRLRHTPNAFALSYTTQAGEGNVKHVCMSLILAEHVVMHLCHAVEPNDMAGIAHASSFLRALAGHIVGTLRAWGCSVPLKMSRILLPGRCTCTPSCLIALANNPHIAQQHTTWASTVPQPPRDHNTSE